MASEGNPKYNCRAALVLGILQVICGVANICIQVPMYVEHLHVIGPVSAGIWTGVFFLITGILTLVSVKANTNCMITAVMVMCILSSLLAAIGIVMAIVLYIGSTLTVNEFRGYTAYQYKIAKDTTISHCVFCLVYAISSIVLSAFCCRAVCCGARQDMRVALITTDTTHQQEAA